MRVLHVVHSDAFAGVERHVARLARAQAAHGDQVVVVGGDVPRMRATVDDPTVRVLPAGSLAQVVRTIRTTARGADVLHAHMTSAEIAASLAGVTLRRMPPVVATRHFARTRGSGPAAGLSASVARRPVRAQISISRYVADHVDGDSVVVHPGIDDRPTAPPAAGRDRSVLLVQRLEPEKRTDLGVLAFAASRLHDDGWQLLVAGDGSQRAALETLVAREGLAGHVRFLGARSDVDDLMQRAAVLLAPCPVEGLGLSVLEAMSNALPVVAAGAGGHLETLAGLDPLALYPSTDVDRAGENLAALARSASRRDAFGEAARTVQRTRFTPEAQVQGTAAVYRGVVRPGGHPHDEHRSPTP
ncbi:glycosyltransferase family 4 protein [Oerskovia paurometabola]|uniref:Glycosyltransferase family 4 protein n=1 Tax=Oerskovia paurometabola TaxID=162170 RepID=A0ABW1X3Q4_9CELL|nr:glycosyltransferase family 4 protein [Oerskovia paurometabola]MBM7498507.1 glycosyltransferase involved in cell wall biosynthesis [Oerskovia paurometabola]